MLCRSCKRNNWRVYKVCVLTDRITSGCWAILFKSFFLDSSTRYVAIWPMRSLTYLNNTVNRNLHLYDLNSTRYKGKSSKEPKKWKTHWFDDSEFLKPEAERTSVWASERWNRKEKRCLSKETKNELSNCKTRDAVFYLVSSIKQKQSLIISKSIC